MLNQTVIVGRLIKDPELNETENGNKVTNITLAVPRSFKNVNGDGVIDESDKEYCGSGIPKLEANLSFSGSYKGLDLSFLLGSAWGHKLYNANRLYYEAMDSGTNMFKSTLNAWTENNSNTAMPRAVLKDPNIPVNRIVSWRKVTLFVCGNYSWAIRCLKLGQRKSILTNAGCMLVVRIF